MASRGKNKCQRVGANTIQQEWFTERKKKQDKKAKMAKASRKRNRK